MQYPRKQSQNEQLSQFSDKRDDKEACEKICRLKLEFYNIDRKKKNITRRNFDSIIMHPNFMHFCQKISFKSILERFASASLHFGTALSKFKCICLFLSSILFFLLSLSLFKELYAIRRPKKRFFINFL